MTEQQKIEIIRCLNERFQPLKAIYLFGSRGQLPVALPLGKNLFREDSDYDFAVLHPGAAADAVKKWETAQELASLLGKDVDLIDLKTASTVLRFQVVTTGQLLFCADEFFRQSFEMTTLSAYQLLNLKRREILKDIATRGKIYS